MHKIKVWRNPENDVRLDALIARAIPELSKNDANWLCEQGKVKVGGRSVDVKAGDCVNIDVEIEVDFSEIIFAARPEVGEKLLPIEVLFEDENFLIVNKPRGLHSVTQKHNVEPSLADIISAYCKNCIEASKDPLEAGLIQRLDYWTSGLVLVAKNRSAHKMLSLMLLNGKIKKSYLALVNGTFIGQNVPVKTVLEGKGRTVQALALENISDEMDRQTLIVRETFVSKIKGIAGSATLVKAEALAAYRHQIRVHLAFLGYTLVGDELYGSENVLNDFVDDAEFQDLAGKYSIGGEGFFLCANSLEFQHPFTWEKIQLEL